MSEKSLCDAYTDTGLEQQQYSMMKTIGGLLP